MTTIGITLASACLHIFNFSPAQQDNKQLRVAKELQALAPLGASQRISELLTDVAKKDSTWAIGVLIQTARVARSDAYWPTISTLREVACKSSTAPILEALLSPTGSDLERDLLAIVATLQPDIASQALRRVAKDGPTQLKALAIDFLAELGARDCWEDLIALLALDPEGDGELTRRIGKALSALAGSYPPGIPSQWKEWAKAAFQDTPSPLQPALPKRAPSTITETLGRLRITAYEDLLKGKANEILVIEGGYDRVQDVLLELGIPCTTKSSDDLLKGSDLDLSRRTVVIANCGTGDWPPAQVQRVRKFVSEGGYLIATDLAIPQLVKHAFPSIYEQGKSTISACTPEVLPARGALGHPLLRGAQFPVLAPTVASTKITWVIDDAGPSMSFNWKKAILLVEAPELSGKKKPTGVAVTFPFGGDEKLEALALASGGTFEELRKMRGGKVLCLLSHLHRQTTSADGFTLKNLLINFLLEAKDRYAMREDAQRLEQTNHKKGAGKAK